MAEKRMSIALLFGLIAAGLLILFIFGTYLAGPGVFVGDIAYWGYIFVIGMGAAAALAQRKANGGWLEFREAVRTCFIVFVLALGARTLFPWLLVNVIDPHFKQLVLPEVIAGAERSYRRFGMPEDQIRQQIEAMKGQNPFPLGSMLMGLALAYIVYFFIALLIAAIVKRKREPTRNPG
jgi:hypothetical protein